MTTVVDDKNPEFQEKKREYLEKLKPFESRLKEWAKTHPDEAPPLHVDDEGNVHWLNREIRRKFKK